MDCWKPFAMTASERAWFEARGLQRPKRCNPCRKAKSERSGGDGYTLPGYRQ